MQVRASDVVDGADELTSLSRICRCSCAIAGEGRMVGGFTDGPFVDDVLQSNSQLPHSLSIGDDDLTQLGHIGTSSSEDRVLRQTDDQRSSQRSEDGRVPAK